jgi:hypothetical protein
MINIIGLLAGWPARMGILISAVVALLGLRALDVSHQQAKGAAKAVAKIERATTNAANLGKRAADRSTASGVLGQRDPTTRE